MPAPNHRILLHGRPLSGEAARPASDDLAAYFEVAEAYDLRPAEASSRGGVPAESADLSPVSAHVVEAGEEDTIELTTEGGIVWYAYADDLPGIVGAERSAANEPDAPGAATGAQRRGGAGAVDFRLPTQFAGADTRGGGFGGVVNAVFRRLRRRVGAALGERAGAELAEGIARELGRRVDDKCCPEPGLHRVTREGKLAELAGAPVAADGPALLFVHGTISSFEGGFGGDGGIDRATWADLYEAYGGRVYAFNHRTITVSPVANAAELLGALAPGMRVDIVSHSRGGLVADALARCDARLARDRRGYRDVECAAVEAELEDERDGAPGREHFARDMRALTALARERSVVVRRIVRVAAPAAGTALLSERLDHFVNALANLARLASAQVPPLRAALDVVTAFAAAVVSEREDPSTFPGLYAMVPERAFARINNDARVRLPSVLISVAGDSEVGGGLRHSLAVILTNLLYAAPNDFVVDTASMSRGALGRAGNFSVLVRNAAVDHFAYFSVAEHLRVVTALLGAAEPPAAVLPEGYTLRDLAAPPAGRRGDLVDGIYRPGEVTSPPMHGDRPVTVLLPGIMGSTLWHGDAHKWVDASALANGALVSSLNVHSERVEARGALDDAYGAVVRELARRHHDVSVFAYDWRLDLRDSARALRDHLAELRAHGQPIRLLAHSMGGLVVRQYMLDHYDDWRELRAAHAARVVLLGTPWRGSHLVTEALTGHSGRVRQLHLLDLRHGRRKVVETVQAFAGLVQMLPLDEADLVLAETWARLAEASPGRTPALAPGLVDAWARFREDTVERLDRRPVLQAEDYAAMTYVAGLYPETVDGYELRYRQFFRRERLRYLATPLGDGSVTWARGVPRRLDRERVYYVRTQHADLANDASLFAGLHDLLETGATDDGAFDRRPPVTASAASRGARAVTGTRLRSAPVPAGLTAVDGLLGRHPAVEGEREAPTVYVEVFNGDLKWARYPVLVGHFRQLGLVSAERALDRYLDGVLTERYMMGYYPGELGDQEVIVDLTRRPRGAIVVGLGTKDALTGSRLAETVRRGLIKYAMFRRDNHGLDADEHAGEGLGVSMMLVGTNFGELPLRESLRNLLAAVRAANADILSFGEREGAAGKPRLRTIRRVEIVDFYEDRAYQAYRTLEDVVRRENLRDVVLAEHIDRGFGRRRRFLRAAERGWWQTLTTRRVLVDARLAEAPGEDLRHDLELERQRRRDEAARERRGRAGAGEDPGGRAGAAERAEKRAGSSADGRADAPERVPMLRFETYTRGSSVSSREVYANLRLATLLARRMSDTLRSKRADNDAAASKVLFELLIPNAYKDFLRNHRNIAWRMDRHSAAFPWELFYDPDTGPVPTFVRAGLVRQLYDAEAPLRPAFVRESTALVVADPDLTDCGFPKLRQLAGARAEGATVAQLLRGRDYAHVAHLEQRRADEVVSAMFARAYKVMHFAAHGVFSDRLEGSGIVLSDGVLLTPGTFRQLSATPELVFVNCCYLGQTEADVEDFYQSRYRLAANVGTQLIRMGVRAVVVAGWAVDDGAADQWARTFYEEMLAGAYFGDAVLLARKRTYERHRNSNTWGAYQCYGDQFYRLARRESPAVTELDTELDLPQEIELELDNLISRARATAYADREELRAAARKAARLLARAGDLHAGELPTELLERKARFEVYTGDYAAALATYRRLFRADSGRYQLRSYFAYQNLVAREAVAALLADAGALDDADRLREVREAIEGINARTDTLVELARRQAGGPAAADDRDAEDAHFGSKLLTDRGSILKRLAVVQAEGSVRDGMRASADRYLRAARDIGLDRAEAIYHACSYMQLMLLSAEDPAEVEEELERQLGRDPDAYFDHWRSEAAYLDGDRESPYASLRGAHLLQTEVLWQLVNRRAAADGQAQEDDLDAEREIPVTQIAERLIARHRVQQERGFNLRDLRGQIEHYDIVLALCKRIKVGQDAELQQLRRVRDWLRGRLLDPWRDIARGASDEDAAGRPRDPDGTPTPPDAEEDARDAAPPEGAEADGRAEASVAADGESSGSDADGYPDLLIREVDLAGTQPQRTRGGEEAFELEVPAGAEVAYVELDAAAEGEEPLVAWSYVPRADADAGTRRGNGTPADSSAIAGEYLTVTPHRLTLVVPPSHRAEPERRGGGGRRRGLGRRIVRFFRGVGRFTRQELLRRYRFHVLTLDGDRVAAKRVKGRRAFVAATGEQERSLLMLHGMFNTARGTFKDLLGANGASANAEFRRLLEQRYGGRAIAMDMPTIFDSFEQNVNQLPLRSIRCETLDIVANSRGTNVARFLATQLPRPDAQGALRRRGRLFLAGGPAFGTPLADADHMLSLVNRVTAVMRAAGLAIPAVGPFVTSVVYVLQGAARGIVNGAGMRDMDPDSATLRDLNDAWDFEDPDTYYVGSNLTERKWLKRLVDEGLIDRVVMQGIDNDAVIPTAGTLGLRDAPPYPRNSDAGNRYKVPDSASCGHFEYYRQARVVERLVRHFSQGLTQDPT